MTMHPKAQAVEQFLKEGGSVCSYGTGAAKYGQLSYYVLPFSQTTHAQILPIMDEFFAPESRRWGKEYRGGCMFINEETPESSTEEALVRSMREEMVLAMQVLMGQRADVDVLRRMIRGCLGNPTCEILQPNCGSYTPVLFGMGPFYDPKHRRYAPETMMPLTVKQDVDLVAAHLPHLDLSTQTSAEAYRRNGDRMKALKFYEPR